LIKQWKHLWKANRSGTATELEGWYAADEEQRNHWFPAFFEEYRGEDTGAGREGRGDSAGVFEKEGGHMIMSREEAHVLLNEWRATSQKLRCQVSLPLIAVGCLGTILSVDHESIRIVSDDAQTELVVMFPANHSYGFSDSKALDGGEYTSCLMVFLGEVPNEGTPNALSLAPLTY
jgi:hypothetical protein